MLKNLGYRDYENISGIDGLGMGRLAQAYSKTINKRKASEVNLNQEVEVSIPHLEALKKKLAQKIEADFNDESGHLPITSVFDALQIIKSKKDASKNIGLRALGAHLNTMWKKDRTANLSANTFLNLKDHYTRNYPKSGMDSVFDEISNKGYFTLPLSDLMHIASQIRNQKDFNYMMEEHGLNGMHPHQVKARNFIIATLNGEAN